MSKLFAIRAKMLSWENRRETFFFIKIEIIYLYLCDNILKKENSKFFQETVAVLNDN